MLIRALALSNDLDTLVFLYQDLKVLLNDSIKLFYILSSKFLIIMRVDFSNLFFTSSLYEGNPSVTIDLGFPKCLACLKRENAHYAE